jgi:hypothetical protein
MRTRESAEARRRTAGAVVPLFLCVQRFSGPALAGRGRVAHPHGGRRPRRPDRDRGGAAGVAAPPGRRDVGAAVPVAWHGDDDRDRRGGRGPRVRGRARLPRRRADPPPRLAGALAAVPRLPPRRGERRRATGTHLYTLPGGHRRHRFPDAEPVLHLGPAVVGYVSAYDAGSARVLRYTPGHGREELVIRPGTGPARPVLTPTRDGFVLVEHGRLLHGTAEPGSPLRDVTPPCSSSGPGPARLPSRPAIRSPAVSPSSSGTTGTARTTW